MTDKEKQVEEMAKVIKDNAWEEIKNIEAFVCAEELYNAGYRKIPKDSVVLTEEEWEFLHNDYADICNARQDEREETARAILQNLSLFMQGTTFRPQYMYSTVAKKLDELAKQFGVDLGE